MKNMKGLLVGLALFIGLVGISHAGGRQGQGWEVTIVTGTQTDVFLGKGFVKAIVLSSGAFSTTGNYVIGFGTWNTPGMLIGEYPGSLFVATAAVTPPIVFVNTTTFPSNGQLTTQWSLGECEECYIEIPGDGGLHITKSVDASGGANQAAVYWSR